MKAHDLAGNRRFIDEAVQEVDGGGKPRMAPRKLRYDYDEQYRLTSESWSGERYAYTYDAAGNRLTMEHNGDVTHYTYDDLNELLTAM